eukprot:scaffold210636_cov28-Tisochrysis_lutea.AAC.2
MPCARPSELLDGLAHRGLLERVRRGALNRPLIGSLERVEQLTPPCQQLWCHLALHLELQLQPPLQPFEHAELALCLVELDTQLAVGLLQRRHLQTLLLRPSTPRSSARRRLGVLPLWLGWHRQGERERMMTMGEPKERRITPRRGELVAGLSVIRKRSRPPPPPPLLLCPAARSWRQWNGNDAAPSA